MGIFSNVTSAIESKSTSIADYTWSDLFPQTNAKSGVAVNIDSALRVTTVLACARVIAEGIAQLPLTVWEQDSDGARTEFRGPIVDVLSRRPNDWMTSFEFREQMSLHAVLTGNAYAYLGYGGGELQDIIPLVPGSVMVQRNTDWSLEYHVSDLAGKSTIVPIESILHLRGPSWNGYLGMETVQLAREAIGLAITTEETHASLHANGAQPGGILSVKGKLDDAAKQKLKTAWQAFQGGVSNHYKTAVLDVESTWTPLGMNGVDSQHLETRRFQIEEICRAMRVFPQMVMHTDKTSTFASAEAFFLSHVTHSLMPWVTRWQEALNHSLFAKTPNLHVKLSTADMLRGSSSEKASFYMQALGGARGETAYMTRNEVRKLEGLNPIEGGDKLLMPPAAPVAAPADPTTPKPGFGAKAFNPDQPRAANGQFGSGGSGGSENHLLRVGATVAVQAIAGALHGAKGGIVGALAAAAIGVAIAAFVEFGGANVVGEHIIALVGPHVLPAWAHDMLVDHHENHGKSIYTDTFDRMSEDDKKRFCLETLPKLSPDMLRDLGQRIIASTK
jgi:HK97 family phage portal protein